MLEATLVFLMLALCLYCLFGGADFGAGILSLFTPSYLKRSQRSLVTRVLGPVWEANHVWLILVIVILFTGFPAAYAQISVSFHIPLTLMLVGIVLRGCAFTFRHYDAFKDYGAYYWRVFELASILTPFFLGIVAAGLIRGEIPLHPHRFYDAYVAVWFNLFGFLVGLFVCALFAFLAAIYLVGEREDQVLRDWCVRQAKWANGFAIILGASIFVEAYLKEIALAERFFREPLSLACFGIATLLLFPLWENLRAQRAWPLRFLAATQVFLILFGWFCAQYPVFLFTEDGNLTFQDLAAPMSTLKHLLIALVVGSALIFPAFYYLLRKQTGR